VEQLDSSEPLMLRAQPATVLRVDGKSLNATYRRYPRLADRRARWQQLVFEACRSFAASVSGRTSRGS
jgi:hypothetical protein